MCLYRVAQEALHNAAAHAQARRVEVTLSRTGEALELVIRDDGQGFDRQAAGRSGLGLISMHERLNLVHGEMMIESRPGAGTRICARVPLSVPAPGDRGVQVQQLLLRRSPHI